MATKWNGVGWNPDFLAKLGPAKGVPRVSPLQFKPYQPPPLPTGTFDPALTAQREAASRGLLDAQQASALGGTRAISDYGIGMAGIGQSYDRGAADIAQARGYEAADYTQNAANENQDYGSNVAALTRNFQQLGRQEGEQARKYGVTSGGVALLSAAKRDENKGLQQTALDTAHTRTLGDLNAAHQRAYAGFETGLSRLGEDRNTDTGALGLSYDRGVTDRTTALSQATREDRQFGLDVGAQQAFQAAQAGYSAPGRGQPGGAPSNEFVKADGTHYKVIKQGGYRLEVDSRGRVLSRRRA